MPGLTLRHRIFLALFALGAFSQVAQALLIRESLVVFYGNEVSLGAFFASWLFWIACGSLIVVYAWRQGWAQQPQPLVSALLLALPPLLAVQILLTRVVRLFLNISSTEFMPLGELFFAVLLITLPTGLTMGLTFPLACKALELHSAVANGHTLRRTVTNVSWLYVLQAMGALAGGILFTFAMVEGMGVWSSLGLTATLLAVISTLLGGSRRWGRPMQVLLLLIGLAMAATPLGGWLQEQTERLRFLVMQPGLELLDAVETRYGHVAVARHGEQTSIVIDGRISESYPALHEVQQGAAYLYAQAANAKRLLLFGGLAGGLAEEFLRYPVEEVAVVEQDRRAFEMLLPHLMESTRQAMADPRLKLHFMDGRRFTNRLPAAANYDLALVLDADPSSAHSNRYFTLEFYQRLSEAMAPDGVLCTAVSSASNYLGREVKSYTGSVFSTLSAVFPRVAIMPGDDHLYCASRAEGRISEDPAVLETRYLDTKLDAHHAPPQSFYTLLPADRIAFVREQLGTQTDELNTDAQPITYYFNMILWGKFSASEIVTWLEVLRSMGYWPYLLPLLVFVLLLMLRASMEGFLRPRLKRHAATFTLVLLGMVAMAVQLTILFAYQAHVGFMFSRVALLNGLFMTGLALGAGVLGQWLARGRHPDLALAVLMGLVAAAMALLPVVIPALSSMDSNWQEAAYLALSACAGLLTGTGFPLGVQQAHVDTDEVLRSSGIAEAADDLGGALGGLVTGALLVPILGIKGTSYLLALFAIIALLPLLHAHFAPTTLPALQVRGYRSFPWPRLSWGLAFLVISVGILSFLARAAAPGPVVKFSDRILSEVSGSQHFEFRKTPVPHYLGSGSAAAAETVSLASMTVAADTRGYAGPLNLLVSVDSAGVLRGVRYLNSGETPAYIAEIGPWLAGLTGRDVSQAPLTLEDYDALTGATVSSRAALESINRTLHAGGQLAFGKSFGGGTDKVVVAFLRDPASVLTLLLLLAFFPVYFSGRDGLRLGYQFAALILLGFYLNTLFTEIDILNLSQGHVTSWATNPQRWLLLGFVLFTAVLLGPVWCGYVCPFGALQELLSRLGRWFYLRSYVEHQLEQRVRYLKFLLLAVMLILVWVSADNSWAAFDPMQHIFGGHFAGWVGAIIVISLVGSVFYVRFWCRYFCPVGALLALFNKLALLNRFSPGRRFEHCDLGVRDEFDVDCIRCNRCISGRDYGVRHKQKGPKKRQEQVLVHSPDETK
jgi:predicted membrane-bound spermidine synthase